MPNIKSAKKRVRSNAKKEVVNNVITSSMRTAVKNFEKSVKAGDKELASNNLNIAIQRIDKAKSSGLVHENKAARLKSRLTKAKKGIGEIGDIVALEVNMRPPGGFTPDLINFGQSVDSYQIYADVIAHDKVVNVDLNLDKYYCCYVGKRNRLSYKYNDQQIRDKYATSIMMHDNMPEVLSGAMGNEFYVARFIDFDEMNKFINMVFEKN